MQWRLSRRFINLSLRWPELSTKGPEKNLSAFSFHKEILHSSSTGIGDRPFEVVSGHVFSVYFLIKENHMH